MELLSSKLTVLYKFVVPSFFAVIFGVSGIALARRGVGMAETAVPWFYVAVVVGVGVLVYWSCVRLKRVELDGDVFVISNYLRTTRVPLADLEHASASLLMNPELVWLRFRRPTDFGSTIVFMPPYRFSMRFTRHPLAERLNERVTVPTPIA